MAEQKQRIYIVEHQDTRETRLVRAKTPAQAVRYVVSDTYLVAVASQDALVFYARDLDVEEAGDDGLSSGTGATRTGATSVGAEA